MRCAQSITLCAILAPLGWSEVRVVPSAEPAVLVRRDNLEVIVPQGSQSDPAKASTAAAARQPRAIDVAWLNETLFTVPIVRAGRGRGEDAISWSPLPLHGPTRRLVPTSRTTAPEALRNDHDAMTGRRRLAGKALRLVAAGGGLVLSPAVHAPASTVFRDPERSVIAAAAAALDTAISSCAITLGPRRYNRKPVVQLIGPDAHTAGYLKVGADEATSDMVANEANLVAGLARPAMAPLELPRVLWRSSWQGRAVACFSPIGRTAHVLPADTSRLAATAAAVVEAGGGATETILSESGPVVQLQQLATAGGDHDVRSFLDGLVSALGHRPATVATWHGDFSPWNMISDATTTALLDWEFSSTKMAVGADLLHHAVMVATHLEGVPIEHALARLRAQLPISEVLLAVGVPPEQHLAHALIYLVELVRRDLELEHRGLPLTGFGEPARRTAEALLHEATIRG